MSYNPGTRVVPTVSLLQQVVAQPFPEYEAIWPQHKFTNRDRILMRKKTSSTAQSIMYYGVFCGPGTPAEFQTAYEEGHLYAEPHDALDFACYLHDKYYYYKDSDQQVLLTINLLTNLGLIEGMVSTTSLMFINGIGRWVMDMIRYIRGTSKPYIE